MDDERSDEQLLIGIAAGPGSLPEFYKRHVAKVTGMGVRRFDSPEDVADFVADVFLEVMRAAGGYDPRRGSAVSWLYGRRRRRRSVALAVAVVALVAAGAVAATAGNVFKPKEMPLGTKPVLRAGETTGVKGMGCQPGSRVTIRLDGTTVVATTTAETGTSIPGVVGWFTAGVTIPPGTPPGEHLLVATCRAPDARFGDDVQQHTTPITVE